MRGAMLFVVGLFTGLAVHVAIAQNANRGVVMMNHVGINVPNVAPHRNAKSADIWLEFTSSPGSRPGACADRRRSDGSTGIGCTSSCCA